MSSQMNRVEGKASVKNGVKRLIFVLISIGIEIYLILLLVLHLNNYAEWINIITRILAAVAVVGLYSQQRTASMKFPWIMLIMGVPVLGFAMYVLIGLNGSTKKARQRYKEIDGLLLPMLPKNEEILQEFSGIDRSKAGISRYLHKYAFYPVWKNTDVVYFDDAAKGLAAQKEDMRKAKKFIFMEYHAIEEAESWMGIQDILAQKVKEGVEVRVFYDDMGSIGFINRDFVNRLEAFGIQCRVFNPFTPGLNAFLNNRDHRKITVIDGRVGYTGGYNLANEYFNINSPYGHWKDTGIRVEGDAVMSFTVTFLEMWNAVRGDDKNDTYYGKYLQKYDYRAVQKGFVQPYADSPMDDEQVGEEVYISVAETAVKYAWYITPYLIITDEMAHALCLAAKRGVDVRVITPGIPDKKLVYHLTRSYYNMLTRCGVRVYEYTPGFCHCKMCVSDDDIATCGTINMDFRSLYHHFENGCLYYGNPAVADTKADFDRILEQSREVTEYYTNGRGAALRLEQLVLRLIAPLL